MTKIGFVFSTVFFQLVYWCLGDICTEDVCEFHFNVRWSQTMRYQVGRAAYDVAPDGEQLRVLPNAYHREGADPLVGCHVDPYSVWTGDGRQRYIIEVNGQFPGPTIEVMEGAQVVVGVTNHLVYEGLSIHFHGLHFRRTPWMDGDPYLTQCPIMPRQTFQYRFQAYPPGTHWWHSHFQRQRLDGVYGFILIHRRAPPIPYMTLAVSDWMPEDSKGFTIRSPFEAIPGTGSYVLPIEHGQFSHDGTRHSVLTPFPVLINGRGRYNDSIKLPLTVYTVTAGMRVRFHIVNAGVDVSYTVSIDKHRLTVVAGDGYPVVPRVVDGLTVHNGEVFEVEVQMDRPVGRYWIRATTQRAGYGPDVIDDGMAMNGLAVLSYEGDTSTSDPTSHPRDCTQTDPCTILNCFFLSYPADQNKNCVHPSETKSSNLDNFENDVLETPDEDIFEEMFNIGFFRGPVINGIGLLEPSAPIYEDDAAARVECSAECLEEGGCRCYHTVSLPYNRTIQVLVSNMNHEDSMVPHAMHLHGHSFAVVKTAFPETDPTTGKRTAPNPDIKCNNPACSKPIIVNRPSGLNLVDPPIKDNVVVPPGGYVVLRFRSDNPGFWIFHCHMANHNVRMKLVYKEAQERIPNVPDDYPTCKSSFTMSNADYDEYIKAAEQKERSPYVDGRPHDESPNEMTESPTDTGSHVKESEQCQKGSPEDLTISYGVFTGIMLACLVLGALLVLLVVCIHARLHPSSSVTVVSEAKDNKGYSIDDKMGM